ncbi:putative uncharacterized protein DDB_G0277255 isoform X2 [Toxorhynchites rutilus septentrionalis]|nr:putative uncharacterized protein DDB_G0277255 isoform X2 [Toxorhynchites rutilus septentrionalis]
MDSSNQRFEMECSASRVSPPKSIIDSTPLQPAMDKNKESLKVKLLVRRTLNQLVEQGIMPSLKTSPAIYEQQRQLERAKTGDLLKAKIKQRPDRMELERRHILEHQESNIDPSIAEKKKMLEKALLVDHLNSKISHRPGPLELIEKNILHADEPIERIVKEGLVNYTSTDEAVSPAQSVCSPESMVCIEDDSLSSEGETQNLQKLAPNRVYLLTPPQTITIAPETLSKTSAIGAVANRGFEPSSSSDCTTFLQRDGSCTKQETSDSSAYNFPDTNKKTISVSSTLKGELKDKSKKKNKNKAISKARSIKFHEYKGPPNAQKHLASQQPNGETNYQLIMKQQYLLEYLEEICKNPPVFPVSAKMSFSTTAKEKDSCSAIQANELNSLQKLPPDPATDVLNKLKVFQLKRYCKKYNLPVSGSKSSLVDRLKPYLHLMEKSPDFEAKCETEAACSGGGLQEQKSTEAMEENLLKEQQKRIAELQRQLKKSQEELEQIKLKQMRSQQNESSSMSLEPKPEISGFVGSKVKIASLPTDKMLSDMDIKITVHLDPGSPDTNIVPKQDPDYASNEIMFNLMDSQNGSLGNSADCRETWKTKDLLESVVNGDSILQCNAASHKGLNFVSNNETLDKLLGQVQPGIPQLSDKSVHCYTGALDTSVCNRLKDSPNKSSLKPINGSDVDTPLVLNDYNDVDLLDFHMHIDDTCDTQYAISKSVENAFQSMEPKQTESVDNIAKMNFESDMHADSNSSMCDDSRMEDKCNIFNDFDGLRFVHNEPYCDIFSVYRNGVSADYTEETMSKIFSKKVAANDNDKNYGTSNTMAPRSSNNTQRHSNFSTETPNIKDSWMPTDTPYDTTKFKPIASDSLQQNTNNNHVEIMNVTGNKNNYDRLFFVENGKSTMLNTCNNNTHAGQVSPMDFDILLSNIDLPIATQNCDREILDENQDKMLDDLQQSSLLDYFNDDYGMQNDTLTCGINNVSY